jgi:hypothetical protein
MGRLFYWVFAVVVVMASSALVSAREEATGGKPAASPAPQSGPALTSVVDSVYMANGSPAVGVLVITWPAFVTAGGTAVAPGSLNVTLGTNGALNVALTPNAGATPANTYFTVVYQLQPAVAAREIISPDKFREGISKIIDGTVECLNASTWCKQPPSTTTPPAAGAL